MPSCQVLARTGLVNLIRIRKLWLRRCEKIDNGEAYTPSLEKRTAQCMMRISADEQLSHPP